MFSLKEKKYKPIKLHDLKRYFFHAQKNLLRARKNCPFDKSIRREENRALILIHIEKDFDCYCGKIAKKNVPVTYLEQIAFLLDTFTIKEKYNQILFCTMQMYMKINSKCKKGLMNSG